MSQGNQFDRGWRPPLLGSDLLPLLALDRAPLRGVDPPAGHGDPNDRPPGARWVESRVSGVRVPKVETIASTWGSWGGIAKNGSQRYSSHVVLKQNPPKDLYIFETDASRPQAELRTTTSTSFGARPDVAADPAEIRGAGGFFASRSRSCSRLGACSVACSFGVWSR